MISLEMVNTESASKLVKNIIENNHSYVPNNSSVGRRIDWLVYHNDEE